MADIQKQYQTGVLSPELYIERNLSINEFVLWARGKSTMAETMSETRLRSIIGPPGSGKTVFLGQLGRALETAGLRVLRLDVAKVSSKPLSDSLHEWLEQQAKKLEIPYVRDRTVSPSAAFQAFLWQLGPTPAVVLLVDGFDEADPAARDQLEQLIASFLFGPSGDAADRYAVVARRDEYGLQEVLLRWEDDVYTLEGLDSVVAKGPIEQIRRRLAAVAAEPTKARAILEWEEGDGKLPDKVVTGIGELDDAGRKALTERLKPHLTPNPYINLALLRRQLLRGEAALTPDDFRACLEAYIRRAGLPGIDKFVTQLIALSREVDMGGEMVWHKFPFHDTGLEPDDMEVLISVGSLALVADTLRYRLDPALHKLLAALPAAEATPAAEEAARTEP